MTTTTAPLTVAEAQHALQEAEAALQALHNRLAAGDTTITPASFSKAADLVRFHQARLAGAERHAEAQAEQERQERLAQLRQDLPATLDTADVDQARAAMEAAIDAYVAACRAYQERLNDALDALEDPSLAPLPAGLGRGQYGTVTIGRRTYRPASAQRAIRDAAEAAVRQHYGPRFRFDLGNPPD